MKLKKYALGLLSAIFLTVTLLGLATFRESQNLSYYEDKMIENNIPEVTGRSLDELMEISADLSSYLTEGDRDLLKPQFNEREIRHMEDVHQLFKYLDLLTKFSLVTFLALAYLCGRQFGISDFYTYLLKSLLALFVFLGLLVFIISRDFQQAFIVFHELLFTNDLWLLNPKTDLMIQMLPENFFSGMALNIVRDSIIYLVALLGIGKIVIRIKE